jgi:hypothetical protein
VAARTRFPLPATTYHDAALLAAQERDFPLAETLFERAARLYRGACQLERLAHARIHQLFVRQAAVGPVVTITDCAGMSERITRLRSATERHPALATVEPGEARYPAPAAASDSCSGGLPRAA